MRRAAQVHVDLRIRLRVAAADVHIDGRIVLAAGSARARQADVRRLPVDFTQQRREFVIQRGAVAGEGRRRRLRGQGLELVQNGRNVIQSAVDGLQNADAIIRVANALRELRDRAAESVGNGEAGGIVAG